MLSQSVSQSLNTIRAVRQFACVLVAACYTVGAFAQAKPLNDTGQTKCYDAAHTGVAVTQANCGDTATLPRQDARFGRDAQAAAGTLTKVGAGAAGFDYTKIANNGSALPASAALGSGPTDWACTRDNVTGLIWEVKTTSGLRSSAHTYTWYSTDATTNGGTAGSIGTNTCGGSLAAAPYNDQCNTQNFVVAVNAAGLCGASDWRMPSRMELLSIVHAGVTSPSIDSGYFPNTILRSVWTRSTFSPNTTYAWFVGSSNGSFNGDPKSISYVARLVRGGQ